MSGGGKSQTSTSSVSIPPEVLERYNQVNQLAQTIGQNIPFQPYTGEFVAPLSPTQLAGISNVNQAAGTAQPYFGAATQSLLGGASQAQPYFDTATGQIGAGLAAAAPLQQQSLASIQAGQTQGQQALATGTQQSQPVYQTALQGLGGIQGQVSPIQGQVASNITGAMAAGQPMLNQAISNIGGAMGLAQPYVGAAGQALGAAASSTAPIQQQALQGITGAQMAGSPYLGLATQYGLSAAQGISPDKLNVEQYMSPYIQSVVEPTRQALQQQQQMEQQKIVGDQIRSGAFGGDRGRIAQAVLAQQQNLGTAKALGDLYQQGYGQALSTAQQQQGVALTAEQANRAAQQQAAQQMLGIGQQGFGQGLAAAQQRAALAQQMFGQGLGMSQQQQALAQLLYGQASNTAQQQAALSQQAYGQQMGAAQAQQALAQQLINQGLGTSQAQAAIGQQLFGQGAQTAQQLYAMGAGTAQQQAAIAQQQYLQNLQAAQQYQALGQGLYGMGAGVSQGLAGLGTAAQQAALSGAQAQIGAGTLEQQTQQAQNQALYNQFLQQQGYPFQVAQFLGNIAMGTGALSGSTTTTTQPTSFFSDKKLKDDIEPIGKTYDGQDIVRYRYKGEPATRIGLLAQDVEKKHPEAVGLAGGYKTVNYKDATEEAAERAPKAYGGGLNPWDGSSMGGGVFREDAGKAYAAGGAPGDDILAQINALVNSHQGIFPYGKAGLYGTGMGKAGPYGSTLMPASNRQLMRAQPIAPPPSGLQEVGSALERAEKIASTPRRIREGYSSIKGGLLGSPEETRQVTSPSGQTTTEVVRPESGGLLGSGGEMQWQGSWGQQALDALGLARGGSVRPGLALGGLPYSDAEGEYVPEDLSKPFKPDSLKPAQTPSGQPRGAGQDIMDALKIAGSIGSLFALSDKRAKENIEPIGELYDGQKVYRYNYKDKNSNSRKGYQAGGDPEEETIAGYRRSSIEDMFNRGIIPNESGGRQFNEQGEPLRSRAGATGIAQVMPSTGPEAARLAGVPWDQERFERDPDYNRQLGLAYFTQQFRQHGDPLRAAAAYNAGPGRLEAALAGGEDYFSRLPSETQDYLRRFHGRLEPSGLIPPALASSVLNAQAASAQPTGVAPPAAQVQGAAAAQPSQGGVVPPEYAPPRPLPARAPADWMERNQTWIMPLLSGLGTMASSPSRYLGSAVLQGLMGAGQGYQQALSGELQRRQQEATYEKTREEQGLVRAQAESVIAQIQRGAIDPNTGTVSYLRPDGTYGIMRLGEYFRRIRAGELIFTAPGRPGLEQPQPEGATQREGAQTQGQGQPQGAQPQAQPAETRLPSALQQHAADTARMLVDSSNYRGNLNTSSAMTGTSRDIFAVAERSGSTASQNRPDRNAYIGSLASIAQSGGLTSAGQMGAVTAPLVAWYNSIIDAMPLSAEAKAEARLAPDKIADRQVIDKITSVLSMQRESEAGQRSLGALRVALQATPTALNSPEGIARLGASYLVDNQRAIDFEDFAKRYRANLMRPENDFDAALLPLAGQNAGLASLFDREYGDRFGIEKKILENMMLAKVPVQQQVTRDGRQVSETVDVPLVKVISESGGNVPENVRRFMMQHYVNERAGITPEIVNGVFRYFLAQGRR